MNPIKCHRTGRIKMAVHKNQRSSTVLLSLFLPQQSSEQQNHHLD